MPDPRALRSRALRALQRLDRLTSPADPERRALMAARWAELPEVARTPNQMVGRFAVGCGGEDVNVWVRIGAPKEKAWRPDL